MIRLIIYALFLGAAVTGAACAQDTPAPVWDVPALMKAPPAADYGARHDLCQAVIYDGEPLAGKGTRVFAWLGRPAVPAGTRSPAMLLVHGGGGRAFRDWAQHWAARGYVALAMDTAGQGEDGQRHAQSGPDQADAVKFREFSDAQVRDQWTYHAVAAVLRGHALLAALPEVDAGRVGITGISWGGYLTCLTAGLDPALKVAVPVYGCGFLGENSYWRDRSLAALRTETRARWLRCFDPSTAVGGVRCPILFLNGTTDFAYPPDSYLRTVGLVAPDLVTLSLRSELPHGHIWSFKEVDAFVDSVLRRGAEHPPLVRLGPLRVDGGVARCPILPGTPPASAALSYTTDTGAWTRRKWQQAPAEIKDGAITATLPAQRPLTFLLMASDARGLTTGSSYGEEGTSANTATVPAGRLEKDFYDWSARQAACLALTRSGEQPDTVLIGDSITHLWGGVPQEPKGNRGAAPWDGLFGKSRAWNFGFGWDRTQNVLQRLSEGVMEGLRPRHIVIHIGTNNLAHTANARANTAAEIAEGIQAIVLQAKAKCPGAKIILMAVMPRGEKADHPDRARVAAINALLPEIAKDAGATLLDITEKLLEPDGSISREVMSDFLHPTERGYEIWAKALRPHLE